jgi:hypothetical protein
MPLRGRCCVPASFNVSHRMNTPPSAGERSFVVRFLGPLVPIGFVSFGFWLLFSGRYVYRPTRGSSQEVVLLAPDAYLAGIFFISLAVLTTAIGTSGKKSWWFFAIGLAGAILSFSVTAWRQISGTAIYG